MSGQPVPPALSVTLSQAREYAVKAIPMLRNELVDPTSFTLLNVHAIMRLGKDPDKQPSFWGCIHYVAGNRMGGREQAWGAYSIGKKGQLQVTPGTTDRWFCKVYKHDVSVEITDDVKAALALQ